MKIQVNKKNYWLGIVLYFLFNTPYCFGYISNRKITWYITMAVGLFLTVLIFVENRGKVGKTLKIGIDSFMIPYFIVTMVSFITGIVIYHVSIKPYITQSFSLMIKQWIIFIVAYYLYRKEKEKSIRLITVIGIICYTTVIIHYVWIAGFDGIMHPFNNRVNGVGLEVHGLTYMFLIVILLVYQRVSIRFI